nr:hypothetical protein [Pirellula sp.]
EVTKRVKEVEQRNMKHFDEEVLKLDHWSDDLKQGLEREIKELDKEIREARKVASLASSLADKLEAQKNIKTLESNRKEKRKRLYEAQDEIDSRRDELIQQIEGQLRQQQSLPDAPKESAEELVTIVKELPKSKRQARKTLAQQPMLFSVEDDQ